MIFFIIYQSFIILIIISYVICHICHTYYVICNDNDAMKCNGIVIIIVVVMIVVVMVMVMWPWAWPYHPQPSISQ